MMQMPLSIVTICDANAWSIVTICGANASEHCHNRDLSLFTGRGLIRIIVIIPNLHRARGDQNFFAHAEGGPRGRGAK